MEHKNMSQDLDWQIQEFLFKKAANRFKITVRFKNDLIYIKVFIYGAQKKYPYIKNFIYGTQKNLIIYKHFG